MRIRSAADVLAAGERSCGASAATPPSSRAASRGCRLFEPGRRPLHIPTAAREVFDVTGAGDTVIATIGLARCGGGRACRGRAAGQPRRRGRGRQGRARRRRPRTKSLAAAEAARAQRMKVAVVGAGPAGALAAGRLARDGARVVVFDASHPREKPCGGGLTAKALAPVAGGARRRSAARAARGPVPFRFRDRATPSRSQLARPGRHRVAARPRRLAPAARGRGGRRHVAERVIAVEASGRLRTSGGRDETFDVIVGRRRRGQPRAPHAARARPAGAPDDGGGMVRARRLRDGRALHPRPAGLPLALPASRARRRRHLRAPRPRAHAADAGPARLRGGPRLPRPRSTRTRRATRTPSRPRPPIRARCSRWRASAGR